MHFTKKIASTVPGNGDVNPYGVAVVGQSQGRLHRGNILVSNFNNSANQQGTGSTIVQITPGARTAVEAWLDGAAAPLARVLDRLADDERAAFLKAMDMLEAEFHASDGDASPCPGASEPTGRPQPTVTD